jgi:2-keto-3-deoxy-L-rhamnonate aldolase RhmA
MNRVEALIQSREDQPLIGIAVYQYNPAFVEMAAWLGYDILWIEREHLEVSYAQATDLCRIASGLNMLTMIRVPNACRDSILKAAECGPDILDLPMGNTPEILQEFVGNARYAPQGNRGFFSSSRASRYGMVGDYQEHQAQVNANIALFSQIETREAVECADELCAVEGIDAIFLGPGDLSTSLGVTGQVSHPTVHEAMARAVRSAKRAGKRVAIACNPADAPAWAAKEVDIFFPGSDITCMRIGAQTLLQASKKLLT